MKNLLEDLLVQFHRENIVPNVLLHHHFNPTDGERKMKGAITFQEQRKTF